MKKVNNKMTYILNDIISKSNNISLAENIPHLLDDQLKSSKKLSKNYLKYFTKNTNRLVVLRKLNNVKFIDDSYAINNYALCYALEMTNDPIIWISLDNSNIYLSKYLTENIEKKVKIWINISKNNDIHNSIYAYLVPEFYTVKNLSQAIKLAYAFADPGDNILFAPNKSNIISKTYSNKFKNIVNEL